MESLVKINDPTLLQSGLALGIKNSLAPLWVDGKNVVFKEGSAQKQMGFYITGATPNEDIIAIAQSRVDGQNRAYLGSKNSLFIWTADSFDSTKIGSGFADSSDWDIVPFGSFALATNNKDPVQVWKNTGVFAPLANTTFTRAKCLNRWGPYILAGNTSNGENWVEWCSDDDIELWQPDSTNTAGNIPLRELDSGIITCKTIGNSLAYYSRNSLVLLNYIGLQGDQSLIFGSSNAVKGIGACSLASVVVVGGEHVGLTQQGVWRSDGVGFRYVNDPLLTNWLRTALNWDAAELIKGWYNARQNAVFWNIPLKGSNVVNATLYYHVLNGAFSIGDLVVSAAVEADVFDNVLIGSGPYLCFGEQDEDAGLTVNTSFIQSKPFDCDQRHVYKRIQTICLDLDKRQGALDLYVGLQDEMDAPIEWLGPYPAEAVNNLPQDRETVYVSIKLDNPADPDSDWRLSGFEILGEYTAFKR